MYYQKKTDTPDYNNFLKTKEYKLTDSGIKIDRNLIHPLLFNWQKDIVHWACRKGRCAIFLDTGLGKTLIQLEWARLLGRNTLIIAPLSVARQTIREATKIDIDTIKYVRSPSEITPDSKLWVTNYEMADKFDYSKFEAIVLDESSILKSIGGKTRQKLTNLCRNIQWQGKSYCNPLPKTQGRSLCASWNRH